MKLMRLRDESIKSLQTLLKDLFNCDYTHEQAQEAGLAIMRFMVAKSQRKSIMNFKEDKYHEHKD